MGFDILGRKPKSKAGEYFRRNNRGWGLFIDLVFDFAPDLASQCKSWGSNDGEGLNAGLAEELANILDTAVQDGSLTAYLAQQEACSQMEKCTVCEGTGVWCTNRQNLRHLSSGIEPGQLAEGLKCFCCGGKGWIRSNSVLGHDDVNKWIAFLRGCGGFEIW
jgi:hypothetical protein